MTGAQRDTHTYAAPRHHRQGALPTIFNSSASRRFIPGALGSFAGVDFLPVDLARGVRSSRALSARSSSRRATISSAMSPRITTLGWAARLMSQQNDMRVVSMSKIPLRKIQEEVVAEASEIARFLTAREARGAGDTEGSMRRVETRYGVPFSILWALRYRRPKDIAASILIRLRAAHAAECERQLKALQHELEIARAKGLSASPLVRAAARLSGEDHSAE